VLIARQKQSPRPEDPPNLSEATIEIIQMMENSATENHIKTVVRERELKDVGAHRGDRRRVRPHIFGECSDTYHITGIVLDTGDVQSLTG
jgi:hypothetical protein